MEKLKKIKPYNPIVENYEIRLDANESFIDLSKLQKKEICKRLSGLEFNRYPDPVAVSVCELFSSYCGVKVENVIAGNGSDELISLIFQTFCEQNDKILLFSPDFSMYEFYAGLLSLNVNKQKKKSDFSISFKKAKRILDKESIKICILSNPCNPTSIQEKRKDLLELLKFEKTLFVVDEAYMEFGNQSLLGEFEKYDNLIILKTLSKACNAAAVRMGFAISNKPVINILKSTKSPYNVNSLSQITAQILLENPGHISKNVSKIARFTKKLRSELDKFEGFEVIKGKTNFVVVKTERAKEIDEFLRKNSISVRLFDGFLRITCGMEQENKKLIEVLKQCAVQK